MNIEENMGRFTQATTVNRHTSDCQCTYFRCN